jgi:hypothetical protein
MTKEIHMQKKFVEAVFKGHYNAVRGYIEGFLDGMGKDYLFYISSDSAVEAETLAEHLREWITLGNGFHHIIIEDEPFIKIREALSIAGRTSLLNSSSLISSKPVKGASFTFSFSAYGRKYAEEIKEKVGRIPEGVSLTDYEPVETIDEGAKGIELYTPAHDYVFEGKGVLSGAVEEIIPLRKSLDDHPLIEADKVKLAF